LIGHRLSTIQDVDRILVLHRGRVREVGTHAELMERKGIYHRLYQLQYFGGRSTTRPLKHDEWTAEPALDRRDFA